MRTRGHAERLIPSGGAESLKMPARATEIFRNLRFKGTYLNSENFELNEKRL